MGLEKLITIGALVMIILAGLSIVIAVAYSIIVDMRDKRRANGPKSTHRAKRRDT